MRTKLLLLFQCLVLAPCFSQTINSEIHFSTRQGKLYTGVVIARTDDSCLVEFRASGLSLPFSTQQIQDINSNAGGKAAKQAVALGGEVEERLQQQAALRLGQLLKQCSFPESA